MCVLMYSIYRTPLNTVIYCILNIRIMCILSSLSLYINDNLI